MMVAFAARISATNPGADTAILSDEVPRYTRNDVHC